MMTFLSRIRLHLRRAFCRHDWEQSCTWKRGCERPVHHAGRAPDLLGPLFYYCPKCGADGVRNTWDPLWSVKLLPMED